jgi:peptidoglycan/LPS O-acetylase OafA/YrhL
MGMIRLFLAISVVTWHLPLSPFKAMNAAVAVVCFFIISGFYMGLVINEHYAAGSKPGWVFRFYAARFLRLYPAYAVMLLVMVGWFWVTKSPNVFTMRLPIGLPQQIGLAAMNILLLGQDAYEAANQAFVQHSVPRLLSWTSDRLGPETFSESWMLVGQAWSLASEFTFYLIAPFVVRSPLRTTACFFASICVRTLMIGVLGFRSGIWGYWFFPGSCCLFFLGVLSYHGYRALNPQPVIAARIGAMCLVAFAVWSGWQILNHQIILASNAEGSIDGVNFWAFYLLFTASTPFVFETSKNWRSDRTIGELSYPLYLVHGLVLGLVFYRWQGPKGSIADSLMGILLSFICAWALKEAADRVVEPRRRRFTR